MNNYGTAQNQSLAGISSQPQARALTACEAPKPTPNIPAAHDNMDKAIGALHEQINILEQRLQPVFRLEPATPQAPQSPQPIAQNISMRINQATDGVVIAASRIQEILRLLEL